MTSNNFIFKTGKFAGKSYKWVSEHVPSYIDWVISERPEMLQSVRRQSNAKTIIPSYLQDEDDEEIEVRAFKKLTPNYNFENERSMGTSNITKDTIRKQVMTMKIGLYSKLSKETNQEGEAKYDKLELIKIIFDSPHDKEIKSKIIARLNG